MGGLSTRVSRAFLPTRVIRAVIPKDISQLTAFEIKDKLAATVALEDVYEQLVLRSEF